MISLAAWMTVSTSALSKLRTTKRPRWSRGTGGAVGGCGIGGGGGGSTAGCPGITVRGPTDVGGRIGSGSGPGGGGVNATGGGVGGGLGFFVAHPEARASRTRIATKRFTLVLRWRLRVVRVDRRCRQPAPEAWRRPGEGRGARKARRRLAGRYHLRSWRRHAGRRSENARHRLRRRGLDAAGHRELTRYGRLARDRQLARSGLLAGRRRSRGPRLRRIAQAHVDHAVGARDHDRVGRDRLHG